MKIIPNDSDTSSSADGRPPSPYSRRKPRKPRPTRQRSRSADHTAITGLNCTTTTNSRDGIGKEVITKFDASVLLATPPAMAKRNLAGDGNRLSSASAFAPENVFDFDSDRKSPYTQRYPANRSAQYQVHYSSYRISQIDFRRRFLGFAIYLWTWYISKYIYIFFRCYFLYRHAKLTIDWTPSSSDLDELDKNGLVGRRSKYNPHIYLYYIYIYTKFIIYFNLPNNYH